jgi:hypothetical protein
MRAAALDAEAVRARLQEASDLADLRPEHRLDSKIGMSADAVFARLREVSELRALCTELQRAGAATLRGSTRSG